MLRLMVKVSFPPVWVFRVAGVPVPMAILRAHLPRDWLEKITLQMMLGLQESKGSPETLPEWCCGASDLVSVLLESCKQTTWSTMVK